MKITHTDVYRLSIPMEPFVIATGTSYYTENVFIRIHTDAGYYGVGECSTFPVITGETQDSCMLMCRDFAKVIKGKNPLELTERMQDIQHYIDFCYTSKSAYDMALHDIAAKHAGVPLYAYLGGKHKIVETDLTIGLDKPSAMAETAKDFIKRGVHIIKIKIGKNAEEDIERVKLIREAVGPDYLLRIDANQGWTYEEAVYALNEIGKYDIEFCEQPLRYADDKKLPALRKLSPIPLMADESVFDHHDAERLIAEKACDSFNIKFSKSGGFIESKKISDVCAAANIPCMMGGMVESRVALTAFAHFVLANDNVKYYDMDTFMLGHKEDPVTGGVTLDGFLIHTPQTPGIGADLDDAFLSGCERITV